MIIIVELMMNFIAWGFYLQKKKPTESKSIRTQTNASYTIQWKHHHMKLQLIFFRIKRIRSK